MGQKKLIKCQTEDITLDEVCKLADKEEVKSSGKLNNYKYFRQNGILFREYSSQKYNHGGGMKQIVLPKEYRQSVLKKVCHEHLDGGHLGMQKTMDRVLSQFHWPGIIADIKRHCAHYQRQ